MKLQYDSYSKQITMIPIFYKYILIHYYVKDNAAKLIASSKAFNKRSDDVIVNKVHSVRTRRCHFSFDSNTNVK